MTHPERGTIMNAVRRKEISRVLRRLTDLTEDLSDILGDIENIKDEESEALENIPESLQETERYAQSEAAADNLEEAYAIFSDMRDSLDDVINSLEAAQE